MEIWHFNVYALVQSLWCRDILSQVENRKRVSVLFFNDQVMCDADIHPSGPPITRQRVGVPGAHFLGHKIVILWFVLPSSLNEDLQNVPLWLISSREKGRKEAWGQGYQDYASKKNQIQVIWTCYRWKENKEHSQKYGADGHYITEMTACRGSMQENGWKQAGTF